MKNVLIIIFILNGSAGIAQVNVTVQWQPSFENIPGDTIYYNLSKKLNWNDFRGTPQTKSRAAAITASGFGYTMAMNARGARTNITISVYCFFDKSASWVKKGMRSDYALLHEQHHFDITYYHASRFIQKLKAANLTRSNYEAQLDKINSESYAELEKMQDEYDGQTRNGILKDVQTEWNEKIDLLLRSLIIN